MQTSSKDRGNRITKREILKRLHGRFNSRQLTELCSEGLLPSWNERRAQPGSKSPEYLWDVSVVEQAIFLYDLLQWQRSHRWVVLPLWLRGYAVEFAPIRQRWLQSIDAYLQGFAQGEEDDPLDNISSKIVQLEHKWKYSSHRPELLEQLGLAAYAQWTELLWDIALVPEYEPDEMTFAAVLAMLEKTNPGTQAYALRESNTTPAEDLAEGPLSWLQMLQTILSLPRVREVIEQATPDEWEQARLDYMSLCQSIQRFLTPIAHLLALPEEGGLHFLFAFGGFYLVPVALAVRQRGYGHWIDRAFAWMSEHLTGPEIEAWFADPEHQAQLTQMLSQQARSSG